MGSDACQTCGNLGQKHDKKLLKSGSFCQQPMGNHWLSEQVMKLLHAITIYHNYS